MPFFCSPTPREGLEQGTQSRCLLPVISAMSSGYERYINESYYYYYYYSYYSLNLIVLVIIYQTV